MATPASSSTSNTLRSAGIWTQWRAYAPAAAVALLGARALLPLPQYHSATPGPAGRLSAAFAATATLLPVPTWRSRTEAAPRNGNGESFRTKHAPAVLQVDIWSAYAEIFSM